MRQEEPNHKSTVSAFRRALSESQPNPSHRRVAKVLERAIAPDMMPSSLRMDDQEVGSGRYIGDLAEVTLHRSVHGYTDGVQWRTRSYKSWEI